MSPDELAAYLGDHAPFHAMPPESLAAVAQAASERTFRTGDLIVDYVNDAPDDIWLVRSGRVTLLPDLQSDADPVDIVEPGGVFGYMPLLSDGEITFVARAAERTRAIRLPAELVRSVFSDPAGLSYLAARAWDTIATRTPRDQTSIVAVEGLIPREPLVTSADTSVRDAVRQMTDEHTSYVLIRLPGRGLGIFTDRDLRTRVVAADVSLDVPIGQVMSAPARTVPADRIASTVLMDMLENGMRHMPVLDSRGRVLGVVEERDLVATSTRQTFVVRRSIALANDSDELKAAADRVTDLSINLFRGGTDALGTSAVLSVMIDAVARRALELQLAGNTEPWTRQFTWLTMGSVARREAMPSSDLDTALSWADDGDVDVSILRKMARDVHATLDLCGLPADSNGAVAYKSRFARSAKQWSQAAQGWLEDPMADRGIIMSSLLLDARSIRGNPALNTVPDALRYMPAEHPNALRLQLLDALSGKVRMRSLRDIVARRGGTFDLKSHALTPIVNLARWAGLTVGVGPASTTDRLSAAAGHGALTDADARILTEVFTMLQRLRLSHQIDQLASGTAPTDIVTMSELSPVGRSLLTDGVREVAAVQRRVRTLATTSVGGGIA